uniref:Conjugal transfer protein TraG N-terminal domain-containing protein n=1 Tax=Roseihalotalea indica TaxID=2867963 RepID=A0AA49GIA1_9BACT|nr:conjugal transfer protein TraG N-terminal domain-containing protein [Tunicatimonas sp. TK19036]
MNNVAISPEFLAAINALYDKTHAIGLALIPLFLLIVLFNQLFGALVFSGRFRLDVFPIVRGLVLLFTLTFYADFLEVISATIKALADFIGPDKTFMQKLSDMWNLLLPGAQNGALPRNMEELYESFTRIMQFDLVSWLLSLLEGSFVYVVRKGIELIRLVLLGFLYVVGPLAIGLSILPGFHSLAMKWLQSYLTVQFWSVTLIILDTLVSQFNSLYFNGLLFSNELGATNFVLVSLVIVILYFMVPHLTSYYLGHSHAAIFQSRVFSTALLGSGMAFQGGRAAMAGSKVAMGAGKSIAAKGSQAVRYAYGKYRYQRQFSGGVQTGKTYEL